MPKRAEPKRLKMLPPSDHATMSSDQLLKALLLAGGWSNEQLADEIGVGRDTVNGWLYRGALPKYNARNILKTVDASAETDEIAECWREALAASFERHQRAEDARKKDAKHIAAGENDLVAALRKRVLGDRQLTRLPALFETDLTLPLATAYVELRITPASPIVPLLDKLEERPTLGERIRRRSDQRHAMRRAPRDALDHDGARCRLILGAPGTGKSSLLRRLALDIAAGEWTTAAVPMFVEARVFAEARRREPALTLVEYACRKAAGPGLEVGRVTDLLTRPDVGPKKRAILLVDGIDEIASDREAVAAVYGALADSSSGVSWIATARPAGLVQALAEDQRYEMAELDTVAIDALVANWCAASTEAGLSIDPGALRRELERVPAMREMATNPFLLTALCFLKSTAPDDNLPNSRIAVYETLIERIAHQAQARHNDPEILSHSAQDDLSQFSCFLYMRPRGAVQIFGTSSWREFVATRPGEVATSFERHILPARLLSVWHESDPRFHFLHLTLQEYLVARAMLGWKVSEALKYRFFPAWRSVFRFYGALLIQRGRRQEFAELVGTLFETRDINNLALITLAEIFADAGLRNTTSETADLRTKLIKAIQADNPVGMEAFIDALALFDPDWLTETTLECEDDLVGVLTESADVLIEEGHDGRLIDLKNGSDFGSPYLRLARAKTPAAVARIEAVFWGDDERRALMAAHAYAEIADPEQRARVADAARGARLFGETARRCYAFALASRSEELLPFLGRLTAHLARDGSDPFSEALWIIADIGGEAAAKILETRLVYELRRSTNHDHQIELCARAVARLGGHEALSIFDKVGRNARDDVWRRYLQVTRQSITPGSGAQLIAYLEDENLTGTVLRVLADAASFNRLPAREVLEKVKAHAADEAMCDAFDLAILERHLIDAGAPPTVCGALAGIAEGMLESLRCADAGSLRQEDLTRQLTVVLDALGQGRWAPARPLVETIMDERGWPPAILEAAIAAAGQILKGSGDRDMLKRLEHILFDEDCPVDAYEVTLAIGRIDLERLFQLRGALTAASTLQQIAVEEDFIVLEDCWADREGKLGGWANPPRRVLYKSSAARQTVADVVSHELSRRALYMTRDWPSDDCAAMLVIEPLGEEVEAFSDIDVEMLTSEGGKVYRIPATADHSAALVISREIARDIAPDIDPAGPPPQRRG